MAVNDSQIQRYCDSFLYDLEEESLFYKLTDLNENYRRCALRKELIELLQGEHERDHLHTSLLLPVLVISFSVGLFLYHVGRIFGFCLPFT